MASLKSWDWGREWVTLYDDHITWYERESSAESTNADEHEQTFEDFLERGPWVNGVPPGVVVELTQALKAHLAGRS